MPQTNSDKKIFGFSRNIFSLGLVSLFTDVSSEMIYPLLPIFLTSVLGMGTTFVGLVEGVAEATASLLKLFSGWVSDRIGKRKSLVVFGYTLSTFTRPLVAAATAGWHVLLIRFLDRVGKGIRTSPRDALIADSCLGGEHGKAFGFQRAMDHAGAVMGPLIAFFFLTFITQQYRLIFWAAYLPGLVALIILIRGVSERQSTPTRVAAARIQLTLRPFDSRFKTFLFIIILFSLGNSSDAFLLLKAKEAGIPVSLIPILWMVLHLVKSLSATPGGILSDRLGRRGVIIAGWLLYSAVYWAFGWAETSGMVWTLFAIYGLFYGLTEGGERALVADLVEPHLRGTAYGLYYFSIGISTLPASLLMGLLWEKVSSKAAFSFGATLALLAALLLWLFLSSASSKISPNPSFPNPAKRGTPFCKGKEGGI
ncbi:MAG: MFS transporter [Thermodesulfobacteriota bacterium]|jgi:MFS family permease